MDIPYLLLKSDSYETREVPESLKYLTVTCGALTKRLPIQAASCGGVTQHASCSWATSSVGTPILPNAIPATDTPLAVGTVRVDVSTNPAMVSRLCIAT